MKIRIYFLLLALFLIVNSCSAPEKKETVSADRMDWWTDAKFGMFIHWGVYSVPAGYYHGKPVPNIGEWIMNKGKIPVAEYKKFAKEFNPVNMTLKPGLRWQRMQE